MLIVENICQIDSDGRTPDDWLELAVRNLKVPDNKSGQRILISRRTRATVYSPGRRMGIQDQSNDLRFLYKLFLESL